MIGLEHISALLVLFISMIVQVVIPPIPAEIIVIAAGKLYGVFLTTLVAGSGLYIGSLLVYFFGKWIRRRFTHLFKKERVSKVVEKLKEHETLILWIRILPYNPSDLISYAAGILHIPKKKFVLISFFTSYIRCFFLALLGTSLTDVTTTLQVLGLLAISAAVAYVLIYRKKGSPDRQ